jgi:hypothetical protein
MGLFEYEIDILKKKQKFAKSICDAIDKKCKSFIWGNLWHMEAMSFGGLVMAYG